MTLNFHLCVTNKYYAIKTTICLCKLCVFIYWHVYMYVMKVTYSFQRNFYNESKVLFNFFGGKLFLFNTIKYEFVLRNSIPYESNYQDFNSRCKFWERKLCFTKKHQQNVSLTKKSYTPKNSDSNGLVSVRWLWVWFNDFTFSSICH